ncbi:DMT family transporter [Jannaschia sp. Os4]|nr:DMT family transporter [Jannaschia sp. Os4]
MLLAGIGIPVLAALNARLGGVMGAPASAAVILFAVALASSLLVAAATGLDLRAAAGAPPHLFLAGALIAFYVLSITWIAPRFGIGNAVFFVLMGQLASAALIDQFGLFGARVVEMTWVRGAGLSLMAAGLFLTQIAGRG